MLRAKAFPRRLRNLAKLARLQDMKTVKISDAKNNLSRYLKYVQKGGRVRVLDRDRPVADIVPVPEGPPAKKPLSDGQLLAEFVRRGIARPPESAQRLPADFLTRPLPKPSRGSVVSTLIEERRGGR